MIKPMLASNYIEEKLVFPLGLQPKIDGVRTLKLGEYPTGRSLEKHANIHTTEFFSNPIFNGLDGEMAASYETDPALCRKTSSALSTIKGEPALTWHTFDLITEETRHLPYALRYAKLFDKLSHYARLKIPEAWTLKLVPMQVINSLEELRQADSRNLDLGYEGSIIRDLEGFYKEGRSTAKEGGLLRIKHFVEEDAIVLKIIEGDTNENEKTVNLLGRSERSSHKENKKPNGMIGSLICRDIKTGKEITVAAGALTLPERKFFFENQHLLLGQVIKYRYFPKGIKDKPRFPTFHSMRIKSDLII